MTGFKLVVPLSTSSKTASQKFKLRHYPPAICGLTSAPTLPDKCAAIGGEFQRLRVLIDGDDLGRGERAQALDGDVAEAADAYDDDAGAGL